MERLVAPEPVVRGGRCRSEHQSGRQRRHNPVHQRHGNSTAAPFANTLATVAPSPQVSIIIPCYDEEATIPRLCTALDGLVDKLAVAGRPAEVIVIDDGSHDGGFARLKEAALHRPWLRLVRFRRNFGQTAAMAAGFERARGQYIVPMDADLQNDPDDVPLLIT